MKNPYPQDSEQWCAFRLGYTDREERTVFTSGRTWSDRPDLNEAYDEGVNAAELEHSRQHDGRER